MKKKINNIIIAALILLTTSTLCYADEMRGPWNAPPATTRARPVRTYAMTDRALETNIGKMPFLWGMKFYRDFISPIDGNKCWMYPTCSGYASRAIRKHGAFIGLMMTVDRLYHEGSEMPRAPEIIKFGYVRKYDPVENNDFWFAK